MNDLQDITTTRPRQRSRSEQKRADILNAAASLFTELGFDNTNMDKVAERAGVSKQTIYSHFGSKEAVFIAAVESKCIANELGPSLIDPTLSVEGNLMQIAQHFTDLLLNEEAILLMRLCCSMAESHPDVSALFFEAGPVPLKRLVQRYLQQQVDEGNLNIPDTVVAAEQFLYMINAEEPFRRRLGLPPERDRAQLEDYLQSCVRLFLRGYGYTLV